LANAKFIIGIDPLFPCKTLTLGLRHYGEISNTAYNSSTLDGEPVRQFKITILNLNVFAGFEARVSKFGGLIELYKDPEEPSLGLPKKSYHQGATSPQTLGKFTQVWNFDLGDLEKMDLCAIVKSAKKR